MNLSKQLQHRLHLVILPLFASLLLVQSTGLAASNETDRQALLAFKSILSDPLGALNSWNDTAHFCQWAGVGCGRRHPDRVTSLSLRSLGLTGPLPPDITNLTFLVELDLKDNRLQGAISNDFSRLPRLKYLNLGFNHLSGEIPASLTRCTNLVQLQLHLNELSGRIPADIGLLSNLQALNLGINNLTGTIPTSIGNLTSLWSLLIQYNGLEGRLPEGIGNLSQLRLLQLAFNNLSGEIPSAVYNFSELRILSVGNNSLQGSLPPTMFATIPKLQRLLLYSNQFHGPIPISLSNASTMLDIEISDNLFSGTVPARMGNSQDLWWVEISGNMLEARVDSDWDFIASLANCSQLVTLDLKSNRLGGNLPSSIADLSPSTLNALLLEDNQISGTIPSEIGKLANLTILTLSNNLLSGPIPATMGSLRNLHELSLSGNSLTGRMPDSIGSLTQLNRLHLANNGLNGSIPAIVGNLKSLQELDLSENKLTGAIPTELLGLSSLSTYLDLSSNLLSGPLPLEVGKLKNINRLSLSDNNLSGRIPSALGSCQSVEYLYLQRNSFEGSIPPSLSDLKGLRELDLSDNNLTGEIPDFLAKFRVLELLNLSYNDLDGTVPNGGVFRNASGTSLLGNEKLCGNISALHLIACQVQPTRTNHLSLALKAVIPILGVVALLVVSSFLYAARHHMKNLRKRTSFQSPVGDQFTRVSYAELLRATDGFSPSNLIGTGSFGSVYKGVLDADENVVAVKVLNLQRRGASKSFMAECETLKHIRHRNLVKIITACSGVDFKGNDFKALVLTYMPNGNLDQWLHPDEPDKRSLTLVQRLNIATDVATALDYLHHHGQTPIVHRDLKPSNVLLDEDFCAHIGDFGLAKFLDEASMQEHRQTMSVGIKGTIGYVAPEYGMGSQPSTQGDAYSYGILLLELFTGKRPTDQMLDDDAGLRKYVEMAFPDRLMDIVDPGLLLEIGHEGNIQIRINTSIEEAKCLATTISIGLRCSKEDSRERMEMGDVINELQAVRDTLTSKVHGGR